MGSISKGILGGFSGTVGTVIGGNWRGIDYMRSKPSRKKNYVATPKQLDQQQKFRLATQFVQTFGELANMTFRDYAIRKTGRNSCVSHLLTNAIAGASPLFGIDFSKVLISRGDLPGAQAATVLSTAAGRLVFNWTNNSEDFSKAKGSDRAILLVHCPELHQTVYVASGATRSAGTQMLDINRFSGRDVHTYIGFISQDGSAIANSFYSGLVMVL
jgi:hypothetical protein